MLSGKITYEYYKLLKNDRLCYIYNGAFNDEMTAMLLNLSEYNVEKIEEFSKLKKRIAFLMAECFQNIIRHKESNKPKDSSINKDNIFITRNIGNVYYITSANIVENEKVENLEKKLKQINQMDHTELKAFYMNILDQSDFSEKGGAGLGLIEMARRSKQPLEYEFEPLDQQFSYFYLRIKLHGRGSPSCNDEMLMPPNFCKEFHNTVSDLNILMVYKGDFSQGTIVPVLKMIEGNLDIQTDRYLQKKRTFSVMTEMLQNISRHGQAVNEIKEGIFLIGMSNGRFVINAGNLVDAKTKDSLTTKLESIRDMNREELKKAYREILLDGEVSHLGGAGLGLITITRDASSRPEYHFYPVHNDAYLFVLDARI